jgi:hypothetical protein
MSNTIAVPTARRSTSKTGRTRRLDRTEYAILSVTAAVLLITAMAPLAGGPRADLTTETVRISSGDTLWSIASAHPVPGLDTAATVDLIAELNGLDGFTLVAGDTVLVPANAVDANLTMRP